jgi:putative endonuclease
MAKHNELGKEGEELAAKMLLEKGYKILARNWRFGKEELDIVAEHEDKLVVVEVKTRESAFFEMVTDVIPPRKQAYVVKAAEAFVLKNDINKEIRFDAVYIVLNSQYRKIEHIVDAFYPLVK